MESSSNVSTQENEDADLIDTIYKEWHDLCDSRFGADDSIAIDLDADTITMIKETLADLHNAIVLHFIKLSVYQRTLEAKLDRKNDTPVGQFNTKLPPE